MDSRSLPIWTKNHSRLQIVSRLILTPITRSNPQYALCTRKFMLPSYSNLRHMRRSHSRYVPHMIFLDKAALIKCFLLILAHDQLSITCSTFSALLSNADRCFTPDLPLEKLSIYIYLHIYLAHVILSSPVESLNFAFYSSFLTLAYHVMLFLCLVKPH
ncbi:hypothetical protein F5B22DRAFT_212425 [Xylaria bambusicola]|uniref:uncharacterized protein n=1 Tax=Xylaria bambusicola TaxID=326684 RepID=UPI002008DC1D|nr:uncharacterized protein F5B22DRAFT_212425 [Xylaria bambusicola]KAI0515005.1 hypothetical protein F5B22DRAFT_212425 [Xylaria bambusicola]